MVLKNALENTTADQLCRGNRRTEETTGQSADLSETEVYCLSEPSVLVSDQTVANLSDINQISDMVENRFKCRHLTAIIIGMQPHFGLEISMNDPII
jgi:hypothetical protein